MKTVTLSVSSIEETKRQMAAAFRGKRQGAYISFASSELLWKVLTVKRWEILKGMTGAGEMTIREVARQVNRDVKGVHGGVQSLLKAGVLEHSADGRIIFPLRVRGRRRWSAARAASGLCSRRGYARNDRRQNQCRKEIAGSRYRVTR